MIKATLNYFSSANKSVQTEDGFRYFDTNPIKQREETISGTNEIEIYEQFYKKNNQLRYCNGSYYTFNSQDWEKKYKEWLNSDDYSQKSFRLYYGNGIVD